jgi:hypothetical protein
MSVLDSPAFSASYLDRWLPVYDVSDERSVVVDADPPAVWAALLELDLMELGRQRPLIGLLGALRAVPELVGGVLRRRPLPPRPKRARLRDLTAASTGAGSWVLLAEEPPHLLVLGLAGAFWRPQIRWADVRADDFATWSHPGMARTLYAFILRPSPEGGTQLIAVMRTATTDDRSRRAFRRDWTLGVGSGASVLVTGVLEATRDRAERRRHEGGRHAQP